MGRPRQDGKEAIKFWLDPSLKDGLYRDIGRGRRFANLTDLMVWLVEGYVNGQEQEAPQRRERMPQGNPNGLESVMLDSPEPVSRSGERPTGQGLRKPQRRRMIFGEEVSGNEYR